jgi:hypothetical protein
MLFRVWLVRNNARILWYWMSIRVWYMWLVSLPIAIADINRHRATIAISN